MKKNISVHTPVAIVGMGCLFARSNNLNQFWRLLFQGKDAITDIPEGTHWSPEDYFDPDPKKPDHVYCRRGGFLSPIDFDPTEFGIPPAVLESTDTSQLLALSAAVMALKDAGYLKDASVDHTRTSVILGATGTQELAIPLGARLGHPHWRRALSDAGVPEETAEDVVQRISEAYVPWQETSFPGLLGNVIAGRICNRLDLGGTNCVVDAACASSLSAVHLGLMELATGRSDMVLSGGVDLLNDIFMHMCFSRTGVLSPTHDVRPFSKDADGTVLGEGVGILALKRLTDAERDEDTVYAVIRGIGTSSDGRSQSIYAPRKEGQEKALREAYEQAGFSPSTVGIVEAHGTGTLVGDEVEFQALKTVFGDNGSSDRHCSLGSVKSMIGHTKAAAGSAGLIKTALALHHKVLPPTLKAKKPDPKLGIEESPFYLSADARPWFSNPEHPRRAGVSAFGFGGSNFHLVMEEHQKEKTETAWDGSVQIFAFSSDSPGILLEHIGNTIAEYRSNPSEETLSWLAHVSRGRFSSKAPHRLSMAADLNDTPPETVIGRLEEIKQALSENNFEAVNRLPHAFYGTGAPSGKLAFLFPGQGSQYVGMARDLSCVFPEAFGFLEKADEFYKKAGGKMSLSSFVHPPPSMGVKEKRRQEASLRQTDIAQPAIGAVSMAMARVLERFGVHPDACCGHSYGELPALCSAGWIDEASLLRLSITRGKCMADAGHLENSDPGAMIVVLGPLETLESRLKETDLPVVLANRNSPSQGVLSGPEEAIREAETLCTSWGFSTGRLPVSAAFHSDIMSQARKPFSNRLSRTRITPTGRAVYSNVSGIAYPENEAGVRSLLRDQLISPVNFLDNLSSLYADGYRTFVEVGPRAILTGLAKESLSGNDVTALSMNGAGGKNTALFGLADLLCRLGAAGHSISLASWEIQREKPAEKRMRIPVSGANFLPKPVRRPPSAPLIVTKPESIKPSSPSTETFVDKSPEQSREKSTKGVSVMTSPHTDAIAHAMKVAEQGLKSMQDLQRQTAEAHQKFLETQAAAAKALQEMIAGARGIPSGGTISTMQEFAGTVEIPEPATPTQPDVPPPTVADPKPTVATDIDTPDMPTSGPSSDHLSKRLLKVVSNLTGYPEEMLGMDMDIESDLGIDSIKRVEILSALEEAVPNLPSISPDVMGGLKTLGQIVEHVSGESSPIPASSTPPPDANGCRETGAGENIEKTLLSVVSRLTGYPEEMLGMDMDIESDLGIDSIKRVEILSAVEEAIPGLPAVSPDMMGNLKTLGQIVGHLSRETEASSLPHVAVSSSSPAPSAPSAKPVDSIRQTLLSVVSRLTGYPEEMLGMDMDIESDLGIDSIKRVEILSAVEEAIPGLPAVSPNMMGSLKTLGLIVEHLSGSSTGSTGENALSSPETSSHAASAPVGRYRTVPVSSSPKAGGSASPDVHGVVYITDDGAGLSNALSEVLKKQGVPSALLSWDGIHDSLKKQHTLSDACGLILVPKPNAFSSDGSDPEDLSLLEAAFALARHAAPYLLSAASSGSAFFATATRIDGAFGFSGEGIPEPVSGALAGLAKTAALEWEQVRCRAFDMSRDWNDFPEIARRILTELFDTETDNAVEIGIGKDTRTILGLSAAPLDNADLSKIELTTEDVVLVTGGARGVTAETALALARSSRPTLVLLGRSPEPSPEPEWLTPLTDASEIKAAIIKNEFRNAKATPREIETAFRRYQSNREISRNIQRMTELGARVKYISTDIRNDSEMEGLLQSVRTNFGPIRGILHGAGVIEDKLIVDKTDAQFRRVLETKVKGLQVLLSATRHDPIRYLILFSSVAARFGNAGQADYAMANEALNKISAHTQISRPDCKTVSINWGPWDGGMVTDSLKQEFARRNVDLIPLETGAEYLLKEMALMETSPEVVFGAPLREHDIVEAPSDSSNREIIPPAEPVEPLKLMLNRDIDIRNFPVLAAHQLNGTPVVPFALLTEWIGHCALHDNPGLLLQRVEDMRLLKGIRMDKDRKIIRLLAGKARKKDDGIWEVDVEIRNGIQDVREVLHSKAKALLSNRLPAPPEYDMDKISSFPPYGISIEEVYRNILFHGHALQGIQNIIGLSEKGMSAEVAPAPSPDSWIHQPMRSRWISDPLVLDSAFQMACVWCYEQRGMVSLPSYVASFRQYCRNFPDAPVTAILEITDVSDHKMIGDVTILDSNKRVAAELKGYEAVMDINLFKAFKPELAKSA